MEAVVASAGRPVRGAGRRRSLSSGWVGVAEMRLSARVHAALSVGARQATRVSIPTALFEQWAASQATVSSKARM